MHVAACFCIVSPLEIQQEHQQQEQQQQERVPDGLNRSFGSWPWQKQKHVTNANSHMQGPFP